jgi:hypothetical protein
MSHPFKQSGQSHLGIFIDMVHPAQPVMTMVEAQFAHIKGLNQPWWSKRCHGLCLFPPGDNATENLFVLDFSACDDGCQNHGAHRHWRQRLGGRRVLFGFFGLFV